MLQVGGARYPNKLICQSTYGKKTNQMPYPTCACATAAEIFLVATEQPSGGVRPVLIQPNSGLYKQASRPGCAADARKKYYAARLPREKPTLLCNNNKKGRTPPGSRALSCLPKAVVAQACYMEDGFHVIHR
jgi:hypothetical protein